MSGQSNAFQLRSAQIFQENSGDVGFYSCFEGKTSESGSNTPCIVLELFSFICIYDRQEIKRIYDMGRHNSLSRITDSRASLKKNIIMCITTFFDYFWELSRGGGRGRGGISVLDDGMHVQNLQQQTYAPAFLRITCRRATTISPENTDMRIIVRSSQCFKKSPRADVFGQHYFEIPPPLL